jgi:hypothetical protein
MMGKIGMNEKEKEKRKRQARIIMLRRLEDDADWKRRDREYNRESYRRMGCLVQ